MASSSPHTLYYERLSPGPGMWFLTLCAGGCILPGGRSYWYSGGYYCCCRCYASSRVDFIFLRAHYRNIARLGSCGASKYLNGPMWVKHTHFVANRPVLRLVLTLMGAHTCVFAAGLHQKSASILPTPADPTPYWIASTRNPEKIAEILNG